MACTCGLHWLPIAVFVLLPGTFILSFAIAVVLGHVEPDFPYISDTGTQAPESCVFGQLLNISAVLVGLNVYVRFRQVEEHMQDNRRILRANQVALWFGLVSALGISVVGNFQETNVLIVHVLGALMAFGVGTVYAWIQAIMSYKMYPFVNTIAICHLRLSICIWVTLGFVCTFLFDGIARHYYHGPNKRKWFPEDGGFTYHIVSTASEWAMAVGLLLYFLTFVKEFRRVKLASPQVTLLTSQSVSGLYTGDDDVIS